jgi:hypothetical protein
MAESRLDDWNTVIAIMGKGGLATLDGSHVLTITDQGRKLAGEIQATLDAEKAKRAGATPASSSPAPAPVQAPEPTPAATATAERPVTRSPIPRAFRAYAKKTWGWLAADIKRIERDKPDTLVEKIAYWRSVTAPASSEPTPTPTPTPAPIGIPYARAGVAADGRATATCPVCGKVLSGNGPKLAARNYADHYARKHEGKDGAK